MSTTTNIEPPAPNIKPQPPEQRLAQAWRKERGYIDKGGFVVIHHGVACGWMAELESPAHYVPGCLAIGEDGKAFLATGGDDYHGAKAWKEAA